MEPIVDPGHELWAHPIAVLAIPAFIPVVVVIVTVLWVARKDRIAEKHELDEAGLEEAGHAGLDPDPVVAEAAAPETSGPTRRRWRDRMPAVVIVDEQGDDHELRRCDRDSPETHDG